MILRHCGRIRPSRSQQSPREGIGNGRATMLRFAQEGAKILAVDPDLVSAEETAVLAAESGGECVAVQADAPAINCVGGTALAIFSAMSATANTPRS